MVWTNQLSSAVTYAPIIGPRQSPRFAPVFQAYTTKVRGPVSNISSMLPARTVPGMADSNPVMKRQMNIEGRDTTAPVIAQNEE